MVTTTNMKIVDGGDDLPNFSDPEDFVDDISDQDLLPDLMIQEPILDTSINKMIVIDNIPKVGTEKKDKLKKVIQNHVSNYGKVVSEFYPEADNGTLLGFMFVEYENEQSAQDAVAQLNGYRLDKTYSFKVNHFVDFDKYKEISNNKELETPVAYKNPGNLMWWLLRPECYDQYCVLQSDVTSVYVNTPNQATLLKYREKWTETRFQWSPKGIYLATFHDRGIALWAGEEFNQFMRFSHVGVQFIDFSPCENYLVTCNPSRAGIDDQALIIWCVKSGQKKRAFTCERLKHPLPWPYFKWNFDDKYFARISTDQLLVYETQTFTLLEKKSIKIPFISDFEWSPTNNYISYWVKEDKNVPARVVLMEIPSKTEMRFKNIVNVVDCEMFWQSAGDYLCVKVERYKKANLVKEDDKEVTRYSGIYYNFEFFRIREKQIPVESFEIKDTCYSFAWEPNGQKFAVIYGDSPTRTTAVFYRIISGTPAKAGKIEIMKEFKNRSVIQTSWSPQGNYCVLASTIPKQQNVTSHAEFYDVTSNEVQLLNKIEHEYMSDFEWDPTGRYFVTYVSFWNHKVFEIHLECYFY
jgi:translation initiation factor 3 subunit B